MIQSTRTTSQAPAQHPRGTRVPIPDGYAIPDRPTKSGRKPSEKPPQPKKYARTARIAQRMGHLRQMIAKKPPDVRLIVALTQWIITWVITWPLLELIRAREFVGIWLGGPCSQAEYEKRLSLCPGEGCEWYEEAPGSLKNAQNQPLTASNDSPGPDRPLESSERLRIGFCRACDCPNWTLARVRIKLRLAFFTCAKGRFGRAPVWWARIWRMVRRSS